MHLLVVVRYPSWLMSLNAQHGTRGLHFQKSPMCSALLVMFQRKCLYTCDWKVYSFSVPTDIKLCVYKWGQEGAFLSGQKHWQHPTNNCSIDTAYFTCSFHCGTCLVGINQKNAATTSAGRLGMAVTGGWQLQATLVRPPGSSYWCSRPVSMEL